MTKRSFYVFVSLALASSAALLTACRSSLPAAASSAALRPPPKADGKAQTYLFMDWTDVEKGRLVAVFDPARLTDEAKAAFERTRKEWGIVTHMGKHGTTPYHMPHGVKITIEPCRKTERWLVADKPWEEEISGGNVIFDQGKYRCWYSATMPKVRAGLVYAEEGRAMETNGTSTCYAESTDGIHWTKPNLGLFAYYGSKSNNMVSPIWVDTPFRDDQGKPEERYKAFTFESLPADEIPKGAGPFSSYGLYAVVSPDGYNWTRQTKPLVRHFCDTWNIAGWDSALKKYVGYFRGHSGGWSITRAETTDFNNWPMPETLMCTGPEELPTEDYYSSGYTTYPGMPNIRLMFPGIFHLHSSKIDSRLLISRDSYGWNWVSRAPIIPNGPEGQWDSGMVFGQPNLLRLPDGRLALPYSGYSEGHDTSFSGNYKDWPKQKTGLAYATWEEGRLAGIEAAGVGEFHANNPVVNAADVQINARTAPGGRIEFQLVQKEEVVPGYTFADCVPFRGDEIWTSIKWKGKSGLADLKDKKVQIHFRLTKAKIFGYRTVSVPAKTASL